MSDDILENLQKLCHEYEKQLQDIRYKIREIDAIPKAKALVGRCFKYSSSSGLGSNKNITIAYKHVIGVDGDPVLVDSFSIDHARKIEIAYVQRDYVDYYSTKYYVEITDRQYLAAHAKMVRL